jgi:hypothetical protein
MRDARGERKHTRAVHVSRITDHASRFEFRASFGFRHSDFGFGLVVSLRTLIVRPQDDSGCLPIVGSAGFSYLEFHFRPAPFVDDRDAAKWVSPSHSIPQGPCVRLEPTAAALAFPSCDSIMSV